MEKLFITIVTLAFLGGIFYVLRTVYNVVCKVVGDDGKAAIANAGGFVADCIVDGESVDLDLLGNNSNCNHHRASLFEYDGYCEYYYNNEGEIEYLSN